MPQPIVENRLSEESCSTGDEKTLHLSEDVGMGLNHVVSTVYVQVAVGLFPRAGSPRIVSTGTMASK